MLNWGQLPAGDWGGFGGGGPYAAFGVAELASTDAGNWCYGAAGVHNRGFYFASVGRERFAAALNLAFVSGDKIIAER